MSSSEYNDSEFDSDASEQELSLYTQLYFGEDCNDKEAKCAETNKNILSNNSNTNNENNKTEYAESNIDILSYDLNINNEKDKEEYAESSNDIILNNSNNKTGCAKSNISILSFDLNISNEKDKEKYAESSNDTLSNNLNINNKHNATNINSELSKKTKKKTQNIKKKKTSVHKRKRTRNPSICSIDSISGREPLDNLYCIDLTLEDDELDTIVEIIEDSENNMTMDSNCEFPSFSNEICDMNDTRVDSDDDVVSILPPPNPKLIETVVLHNENSNSSSIIEIDCVKRKKSKSNLKNKKRKTSKEKSFIVSSDSNHSSESEDDDNFDVSSVPLVFKLGSSIISTKDNMISTKVNNIKKKSETSSVSLKSSVIFSKFRPLTNKIPSCPTWTQEMASLYDSDYSDEFSVQDIHALQKCNPKNWKICSEDFQIARNTKRRYFELRCIRCKEVGHSVNSCKRLDHCLYCSATNHKYPNKCPKNCCLRCGKAPHRFCPLTSHHRVCRECKQFGHDSTLCPDLWRRFHSTTSGTIPVIPDKSVTSECKRMKFCFNCSRKDHYGHECKRNFDNRKTYTPASTKIFSYEPTYLEEEIINVETLSSEKDVEVSVKKNVEIRSSKKGKESTTPKKKDAVRTLAIKDHIIYEEISLTKAQFNMFKNDQQSIVKQIEIMSKPSVNYILLNKRGSNIAFSGTRAAIQSACSYVTMVLNREPWEEYNKFMTLIRNSHVDVKYLQFLREVNIIPEFSSTPQNRNVEAYRSAIESLRVPETPRCKWSEKSCSDIGIVENSMKVKSGHSETGESSTDVQDLVNFEVDNENDGSTIFVKNESCTESSVTFQNDDSQRTELPSNVKVKSHPTDQQNNFPISVEEIIELPLPLPRNRIEAIKALEQAGMKLEKSVLKNYTDSAIEFFEKHSQTNVVCNANYLKYMQALARIVYIHTEVKWGVIALRNLKRFKEKLLKSDSQLVDDELHDKISNFYWRFAKPPFSRLKMLLKLTKEFKANSYECKVQKTNEKSINKHIADTQSNENEPVNSYECKVQKTNEKSVNKHIAGTQSNENEPVNSYECEVQNPNEKLVNKNIKDLQSNKLNNNELVVEPIETSNCIDLLETKDTFLTSITNIHEFYFNRKYIIRPFLPIDLPHSRTEAIGVLQRITGRKNTMIADKCIRDALTFFRKHGDKMDIRYHREYIKNFQLLSYCVYAHFELGKGPVLKEKLTDLAKKLQKSKTENVDNELYTAISAIYKEFSDPPYSDLEDLLQHGKSIRKKTCKERKDRSKRQREKFQNLNG